ncbi:hypothetical protein [Nocardia abscessus]|uniref:hypothetical protein n=1 Tax=Nocardia abscessus TaxID=120957 RepID=UPI00030E1192|nr:hypothetical protein [Nocardia abscessus]MCC3333543.1 hypothetical protein [Nocardia abscessus]
MIEHNPVAIENAIRDCANRIAAGVATCDKAYTAFLEADRAYDRAFAHAYLNAIGAAHERKYRAEIKTQAERERRDVADAAYRFADRTARALEAELRAWQSVNKSVVSMFGAAGRGEY